ncbi:MAG: class I SAM-dependent methyltransferase [Pseudanabaena sp.]|nr:MAG: class I SAM-dependent methyltransferase [Pseudanabaena sp.]
MNDAKEVRSFYERMPYPAPLTNLDRHLELYQNPERKRALFHLMFPTEKPRSGQQILVAGCGTSQAATIALREPDAQVTAIDISETSLSHTRNLQHKYKLENLELHQLAIANVQDLDRQFDQIICTGVLHHLSDPDLGLRSLREVLKPTGAMHLMVYALYGRTGIYMLQEYCRLLKVGTSDRDLQDLSTMLDVLPSDHPISNVLHQTKDFKHPDALADALLHPQDRAYSVPQLFEWLDRCGMSFGRWFEQATYLTQCGMVAKSPHTAHIGKLPMRSQYAAVELFRGTITKHNFIAYRDDYPNESQPIQFDEAKSSSRSRYRWRQYIPLRLPWTMSIRERLPLGAVAIAINRAHTYPDLILPIDAEQELLLNAIDGKRTLNEIIQIAAGGVNEKRSLKFFKRLWQYDQIVFDAS